MQITVATPDRPSMEAMVLEAFGAPLVRRRVARPSAGPRQAVVAIAASGVNPLDTKIHAGAAGHARVTTPAILGIDLAGVVVEIGSGVTEFAVGDDVYGMTGGVGELQGSLAQYAAVDVDLLAPKPARLSMIEAAALPLSAITAWEALDEQGDVQSGHRVLVHGGAGGVGHVAVQLAVARGATVFATGSGPSLEVIAGFGATPIDRYTAAPADYVESLTTGRGFDVVVDTVGGEVLDQSFTVVRRRTGRVVSILGWGTHSLAPLSFRAGTYSGVFTLQPLLDGLDRAHHGAILRQITEVVDAGQVMPIVDPHRFDLDAANDAHALVESGAACGKVVVEVPSSD
jgi:NADPH:quinone reductase-like Zn-dependent oxidoreductase